MELLAISFVTSQIITLLLIRSKRIHERISGDSNMTDPQKTHTQIVPRIGGIGIFFSLVFTGVISHFYFKNPNGILLISICFCCLPAFTGGLIEDLTKNGSIKLRLAFITLTGLFGIYVLNASIVRVDISAIDSLLTIGIISIIFTSISVTGLTNAYNIIDGFNGLASMIAIIALAGIGYVAFKTNDLVLSSICLISIGAIIGFFSWNYPRGSIFLGDCGAYLIGSIVAFLSILLIIRNPSVSPWFALLVNIYPVFETLFSIWRRKFLKGANPSSPDAIHFHSLIYRRVLSKDTDYPSSKKLRSINKNSQTSHFLWAFSSLAVLPAIIWWQTTPVLQAFTLIFCFSYLWAYKKIVKFQIQKIQNFFRK
jgi:UDP-GlcNAc:undecaprenyl-phosphate/decaprenyl-phosphate GlcNAc-1-phosphate transferase